MRDTRPILPVPLPVCPICDTQVTAFLCQASPRTDEQVTAIQDLVLHMHNRLAHPHPDDPPPSTHVAYEYDSDDLSYRIAPDSDG